MSRNLIYRPQTWIDLDSVVFFIALDNASAATRLRNAFLQITQDLLLMPERGPVESNSPNGNLRRVIIPHFRNYLVFYRVTSGEVIVLRILHSSRNWSALLEESGDL